MQKIMKNKGITLVALVVSIIIMLILAGVTLNIALGENGLFKMTQQVAEKYKTAQREEESTMQGITDELQGLIGKGKDDKTPGVITGEGTEAKPFLIESIEDLVEFSNKVNSGITFENQIVKLAVNLDFKSEDSYSKDKNKMEELTSGTGFTSIGNDQKQFKGTFDGQNRTISNLYIKKAENYKGLFGYVGSNGSIKNLKISDANINCKALYIGTLSGYVDGGIIENINISSGNLQGNRYVGGITGFCSNKSTINNCLSNVDIIGNGAMSSNLVVYLDIGGITGFCNNSTIMNSRNLGNLSCASGLCMGGIAAFTNNALIDSCYNEGNVGALKDNKASQLGGIVGEADTNTRVTKCYNCGNIDGQTNVGGIAGILGSGSMAYIEDCYNAGTISIKRENGSVGGISTVMESTKGCEIKNCYNIGNIVATVPKDGIARKHCRNRK